MLKENTLEHEKLIVNLCWFAYVFLIYIHHAWSVELINIFEITILSDSQSLQNCCAPIQCDKKYVKDVNIIRSREGD